MIPICDQMECQSVLLIWRVFPPSDCKHIFSYFQSQYFDILPYLTFGGMALAAAILILLLPETRNKKLPDTLYEAENIDR